jgi:hypothetical protein
VLEKELGSVALRNGTYLREPDGGMLLYYSPYSFNDAAENFRKRDFYEDAWHPVSDFEEEQELHNKVTLAAGEYVFIRGGRIQ